MIEFEVDNPTLIEQEALKRTTTLLEKLNFPFARISVALDISYKMSVFASNKIALDEDCSRPTGSVSLSYNGLFLHQNISDFIEHCIPHELAHVMHTIECAKEAMNIDEPHGLRWQQWLKKLNAAAVSAPGGPDSFDARSVNLNKGGIPVHCECGEIGFSVFSNSKKSISALRAGGEVCRMCEKPFVPADPNVDVPNKFLLEIEFLRCMQLRQTSM